MSIVLYKKPQILDFAGNQLPFRIKGTGTGSEYKLLVTLFVENLSAKGTFSAIPEFEIQIDSSQIGELCAGPFVKSRFRNYFDLPDFSLASPVKAQVSTIKYYLVIREMDGTTEVSTLTTETFTAINGKTNISDYNGFNLLTWINAEKRFLTNAPTYQYFYDGGKVFLYYLNPYPGTTSFTLTIKTNHSDIVAEQVKTFPAYSLAQSEVMIIPLSEMMKTITSYASILFATVTLFNGTTAVAGEIFYQFLPKSLFYRSFLFVNRMGVFDTIHTFRGSNNLTTEKNENVAVLTPNYSRYIGNVSSEITATTDSFEVETGEIPPMLASYYKEAVASPVVFLVTADRYVRVEIEKGSFKISDDEKEMSNVAFKYRPSFDGDIISTKIELPKPAQEDYSDEYLKTDYK